MAKPYKLSEEIKLFIVKQKGTNPGLSCRGLIPLVREHFQVSLSKSLINNVLKKANLSSPVGKRGEKKPINFKQPLEIQRVRKEEEEFIENGGCFFLKLADLKLCLSAHVFGKEASLDALIQYCKQSIQSIPSKMKEYLLRLNSYVQVNFFPSAYEFLDFSAMQERFYCLWARKMKNGGLLQVQFLCPQGFPWRNDIVWQEDLSYAVDRVNESRIFASQKEQVWINPKVEILPANLPPYPSLSP
jgi:hypothetical protein